MKHSAVHLLAAVIATGLAACGDDGGPPAVGTLERDRIELVAEAQEPVVERPVEEGDLVRKGDLVLRQDDERLRQQVAQAESRRDAAAARLAERVRGPRAEQITETRARLAGAQSTLETAERELARAQQLVESGVESPETLDRRRAQRDQARAERDAARALLSAQLEGTTIEELDQARAALAEAEAALAEVRVRAERLSVRAPRDARVDALPYEVGERPAPGAVVAVLLADEVPYARVYVPEPIRAHVVPGTPARVYVDGLAEPLRGRVRTVSEEAAFTPYYALTERDRGRLAYVAKIDLDEAAARRLPSGLPVQAEFDPDARRRSRDAVATQDTAEGRAP